MNPLHIVTDKNNIAEIVLFPGDPLRAKYIAEKYLENPELINTVRNMLGFTGTYKGKRITVIAHGMGIPSIGIYAYELFHFYNVKKVIRIGTAGAWVPEVKIRDLVLATKAYSDSNFAYGYRKIKEKIVDSSKLLNDVIINTSKELNIPLHAGTIYTTEVFDVYQSIDHLINAIPRDIKPIACEMEAFGLFHIAEHCGKDATCIISIVDSKFQKDVHITAEEREQSLDQMIILALESIIK